MFSVLFHIRHYDYYFLMWANWRRHLCKDVSRPKVFVRGRVVNTRQYDRSSFCHQMAILVIAASLRVVLTTEAKKSQRLTQCSVYSRMALMRDNESGMLHVLRGGGQFGLGKGEVIQPLSHEVLVIVVVTIKVAVIIQVVFHFCF